MRILSVATVGLLTACTLLGPLEVTTPSPTADDADDGGRMNLTGTLNADAIEGGCAYLQAADGTKYEVIYPDGWRVSSSPLELRSPSGEVVATGGDTVTVRGDIAGDMASICQVGPIFQAMEVVSIQRR
jgi:hypothetical protein